MRNQLKADLVTDDEDFEIDWKAALEMIDRREAATRRIEKIIVDRVNQSFASIIDQAVAEKIKKAIPGL